MAIAASMPIIFANRFEHATDGQLRTQVPSKWRPEDGKERYFVQLLEHKVAGEFLRFLPSAEAVRLRDELSRKGESDASQEDYKRAVASEMEMVDLDSAGRVTLPETMAKVAGIGKNDKVMLTGSFGYFEIWSMDRHARVRAADEALKNKK